MKIKVAKHIGFCFGVRRAVNIAQDALSNEKKLYCLGSLIHNPQEVERLSKKGLTIVGSIKDIKKGATLIIRSHGLLPGLINEAKKRGIKLIDATCPFVKKAQNICKMLSEQGFDVVVIGDRHHPEVKALVGFANNRATVIEDLRDLKRFTPRNKKIGILAQTTQSIDNFQDLLGALLKKSGNEFIFDEIRIFNTICGDSSARQASAKKISFICDGMLVIGGKNSANSQRLFNICRKNVANTYHIEAAGDINPKWFRNTGCIGVVSGASTPDWIINDVTRTLNKNKKSKIRRIKTQHVR